MRRLVWKWAVVLVVAMLPGAVLAQGGGEEPLPEAFTLDGFQHVYQGWNNCGPATLTTAFSFFGFEMDQGTAAAWLKPDPEDKNVTTWQMAEFVNTQTELRAMVRFGGDLALLRRLIVNGYPVIVAAGFEPEDYEWMGHYLLVTGYDQNAETIITQDSFLGPDTAYDAAGFDAHWLHFNRVYLIVYEPAQEAALFDLLGDDADETLNAQHALATARTEAAADPENPFAWFNLGTSFVLLEQYEEAAVAYDQARSVGDGLPWRMLWYQFGIFEAYYAVGRYDDVIALAQYNLRTTPEGEHPVEETYYYAGLARAALGETDRALLNFQYALAVNPNFAPAQIELEALSQASAGG